MRKLTNTELISCFQDFVNLTGVVPKDQLNIICDRIFLISIKPPSRPFNWAMYETDHATLELLTEDGRSVVNISRCFNDPARCFYQAAEGAPVCVSAVDGKQLDARGRKVAAEINKLNLMMRITDKPVEVINNPEAAAPAPAPAPRALRPLLVEALAAHAALE